ncbi:MAG: hypothetical protein NC820_08010, partial [Candidatus Omnitrophica bacterium]|nr:hypothetical protein [Candidatus Omnitrophota bacterium]
MVNKNYKVVLFLLLVNIWGGLSWGEEMKFLPQGKHLNKDYFVAYSPQDKEVVVRIKGKFPSDEK